MERILIVRLGAMGDVVCTLPAVAALRASRPDAQLGWVIEERWADLLASGGSHLGPGGSRQKPLVDAIHLVDTKAWRAAPFSDETWREVAAVFREIRGSRYDLAIDFQGLWKSALFARGSGAAMVVGFAQPKERLAALLYTRRIAVAAPHILEQNLELAESLAVERRPSSVELLPYDPAAESWCDAELKRRAVGQFAILSPGAGWGAKVWPAERYGEVARAVTGTGLAALVNFGPGEEELAKGAVAASGGSAQAIRCSVGELIALTRRARLFIGGDSGPMHLAAALKVPVIAIFGPTDPARNGPYGTRSIVLRSSSSATSYSHREGMDAGLQDISVEQVSGAVRQLLETEHA